MAHGIVIEQFGRQLEVVARDGHQRSHCCGQDDPRGAGPVRGGPRDGGALVSMHRQLLFAIVASQFTAVSLAFAATSL